MVFEYPDSFVVGREKVREYARAVKSEDPASLYEDAAAELGHDSLVASPTFVSTLALLVQRAFFQAVDIGMETMQIVQVDQRFVYHKPIKVGDTLYARMDVQSVEERFGADIVVTRNLCLNADGETMIEAFTTLMGQQGEESARIKFDVATGQIVRKD